MISALASSRKGDEGDDDAATASFCMHFARSILIRENVITVQPSFATGSRCISGWRGRLESIFLCRDYGREVPTKDNLASPEMLSKEREWNIPDILLRHEAQLLLDGPRSLHERMLVPDWL